MLPDLGQRRGRPLLGEQFLDAFAALRERQFGYQGVEVTGAVGLTNGVARRDASRTQADATSGAGKKHVAGIRMAEAGA